MAESLDPEIVKAIDTYGKFLNNTGGNPPTELLENLRDNERMAATNIVRYVLAVAVQSQLTLILRLQAEGVLLTQEQLALYKDASWAANQDRMEQ